MAWGLAILGLGKWFFCTFSLNLRAYNVHMRERPSHHIDGVYKVVSSGSFRRDMSRLSITVATWDYDRVRAIFDGRVRVEGCDVNYLTMPVEECFERAFFHGEFEVAEIGFSPYLIALSRGEAPYVAVPAFLSRTFRHSAIYVRNDRGIERPQELCGKRIGVPEYQMSAAMWVRGFPAGRLWHRRSRDQMGPGRP
jgi:hypothetical protein